MKEVMNPGQESGSLLSQDFASQHATCLSVVARCKHLCVVCALSKHDFEERAPQAEADECDAAPLAKAWIDGVPYRSVYHLVSRGIGCTDCGQRVMMTYDPEHVDAVPLALCKA